MGCTSAFSDIDVDDTKTNNKNDSTYDDSYDWEGKCQYENIWSLNIFLILCNHLQNHINLKEDSPSSDDENNVNSYPRNGKH